MQISIIICCYNSASRIRPTLEHIAKQLLNGLSCEVILVDNNCSDDTIEIAQLVLSKNNYSLSLKIIVENKPGLSHARRSGVEAANGEIIVFCDDDNWLEKSYVEKAYSLLKSNPNIGIVGGRSLPITDVEFPFWFTSFQNSYAVGVQALNSGVVNKRGYLWGAGMSFRRIDMLNLYKSGFVNILTGRMSDGLLMSGDDSEICKWFRLIEKDLYYDEDLVFYHFIDKCRLDKNYLNNLHKSFNHSEIIIENYNLAIRIVMLNNLKKNFNGINIFLYLLRSGRYRALKVYFQLLSFRFINFTSFYRNLFFCIHNYKKISV